MNDDTATTNEAPADPKAPKKPQETLAKYQKKYGKAGNNGDKLAVACTAYLKVDGKVSEERVAEVAKANGIDMTKYAERNIGMKSMNLRNLLRGKLKKGESVTVGTETISPSEIVAEAPEGQAAA